MSLLKLNWGIAGLLLIVFPSLGWAGQVPPPKSPFLGEFFVTRNADDICVPYTRSLNQFRRMDFNVCDARLSAKFPSSLAPHGRRSPLISLWWSGS